MGVLAKKRILVGITGGIAAYKSAELVRLLKSNGADVRVVMTESASQFITPLTLQALSGHSVFHELFDTAQEAVMSHIELARWADFIVIAPASANTIAKVSHGFADDLLTTICLASTCPIAIAPAMNQAMWSNSVTQANCQLLLSHDYLIFGPGSGEQACGDLGFGRMLEPHQLVELIESELSEKILKGVQVLLTSGPTRETIDPVRYISNHSSGKMGYALARTAHLFGADVKLISGPSSLEKPVGVNFRSVNSASEMYDAVFADINDADIFISVAAVADYKPQISCDEKIKKNSSDDFSLTLTPNKDILAEVGKKADRPFLVGFAAETNNLIHYAEKKLVNKNLDIIFANDVSNSEIGFNGNENAITAIWPLGRTVFEKSTKKQLSFSLLKLITQLYNLSKERKLNE